MGPFSPSPPRTCEYHQRFLRRHNITFLVDSSRTSVASPQLLLKLLSLSLEHLELPFIFSVNTLDATLCTLPNVRCFLFQAAEFPHQIGRFLLGNITGRTDWRTTIDYTRTTLRGVRYGCLGSDGCGCGNRILRFDVNSQGGRCLTNLSKRAGRSDGGLQGCKSQ